MSYRVDNIPFYLKPLFWLYGYVLAFLLYAFIMLLRVTCRIRFEGEEVLRDHPAVILCSWHENVPSGFVVLHRLIRGPQVWMNHPAWYMKPIHVLLWLLGVRGLVLGSTGYEGREAATKLVKYLQEGYSTLILPDGPYGPAKELKKGALHVAAQSNIPLVALQFRLSNPYVSRFWDKKRFPYPFSQIIVKYSQPIFVTPANLEEKSRELAEALGS
jgi:lysophospholipid acyltransferase (LPLAT)-like uncharacterized protein